MEFRHHGLRGSRAFNALKLWLAMLHVGRQAYGALAEEQVRLAERIAFIHEHTMTDALVEEFIEGRELYVGVLGNERIRTLTPWEFIFGELKSGRAAIATRKAKWDRAYQARHGITSDKAADLPPGALLRVQSAFRPTPLLEALREVTDGGTFDDLLAAMIESLASASAARLPLLRQCGTRIRRRVMVSGGMKSPRYRSA